MMDMLMIIVRWLVGLLPGGLVIARSEFVPLPVRADFGLRRGGCYPASSPGVGWMTMRLDSVLPASMSFSSALACDGSTTWPRSAPNRWA
jgi:hypothetical protein